MSIAVLDKAFSILEVLARNRSALTLTALAEESRLPKPTVHRILKSLRDLGYAEQTGSRSEYQLSERLLSLRQYGRDASVWEKALPLMEQLHRAFDETVNLGLLEGVYVRYVRVIETTQSLRWIVKPGARDPFHTTALGRAIVSVLPVEQQSRLIAKTYTNLPAGERQAARQKLKEALRKAREVGYAEEHEETVTGVACAAISLTSLGEPLAAVSVSVPVNRLPSKRRQALLHGMVQFRQQLQKELQAS